MRRIIQLLPVLFFVSVTSAQAPEIEWQNTIGGNGFDELFSIQTTSDGGYILGGHSDSDLSGDKTEGNIGQFDYWIIKLNEAGEIEWQNTIGGNAYDELHDLKETTDGGYILAGYSISGIYADKTEETIGFSYDYWVVKLDNEGNIEWDNTIGGDDHDWLESVDITVDGGYILGGYSRSGISGDKTEAIIGIDNTYDYWVIKLNAEGDIEWQNTIGGSDNDYLYSLDATADGGYILGGKSLSDAAYDKSEDNMGMAFTTDYWIVKLDSFGNIEWDNTIGGNNADILNYIKQTIEGGFILGGYSGSDMGGDKTEAALGAFNNYDLWILKLNEAGEIEWQNTIWGYLHDYLTEIHQTQDGGYIIAGYSTSDSSGDKSENSLGDDDYWIIKLDNLGNIEWENTIGGNTYDYLLSVSETTDGGFILGGYSNSEISGDKTEDTIGSSDYWIIKLLSPDCITFPFYADSDEDGYGNSSMEVIACVAPIGYVPDNTDCNDTNADINPGVAEICNDLDDDCSVIIDDGLPLYTYYLDDDDDEYGNIFSPNTTCSVLIPIGYVTDSTDCDDANSLIHEPILYYADNDGDLYGDELNSDLICNIFPPFGYATNNLDCDDTNIFINPVSNEIFNGLDDNCNDTIDEGYTSILDITISNLEVYPNPNTGNFSIELDKLSSQLLVIEIYNVKSEKIYSNIFNTTDDINIHLPESASGVLNVLIKSENEMICKVVHVVN